MRAATLVTAVLALASACATQPPEMSSRALPESATTVPLRRDDSSASLFQGTSGMTEPARLLIRNEAEWHSTWSRLVANVPSAPAAPTVDFTKEMVIVAAMGAQPTSGHMIHIARVGRTSGVTYVEVLSESPGKQCRKVQKQSAPADVVVVPAINEPVTFVESSGSKGC